MIIETAGSLSDYLDATNRVAAELRAADGPVLRCLEGYHGYFSDTLWEAADLAPAPALASMNAFMLWLAAVRTAMSGHAVAAFPLLRTSLESASYAFLMKDAPELATIWLERHKSTEQMKLCRRRFTPAVRETAAAIEAEQAGGGAWILDAYESSIDFGAHPNVKSVLGHLVMERDRGDEYHRLGLVGVYSAGDFETKRAMLACLDIGLAVAVVLTRAQGTNTEAQQVELAAIADAKNLLVEEHFSVAR